MSGEVGSSGSLRNWIGTFPESTSPIEVHVYVQVDSKPCTGTHCLSQM